MHPDRDLRDVANRAGSRRAASAGFQQITEQLDQLGPDLHNLNAVFPQLVTLLPPQIETLRSVRAMMMATYATMSGIVGQTEDLGASAAAMGQDFDTAQTDDSFYLPREVFDNPDFQRVVQLFMSPAGNAARFIINHRGNPASAEGIGRIDGIKTAAEESLKGTPWPRRQSTWPAPRRY